MSADKLAQALELAISELDWLPTSDATQAIWERQQRTLGKLREALAAHQAQQTQEPVAWMRDFWGPDCGPFYEIHKSEDMTWRDKESWTPLYTSPQPSHVPGWQPPPDPQQGDKTGPSFAELREKFKDFPDELALCGKVQGDKTP